MMISLQKILLAVVFSTLPSCLFAQAIGGVYIDSKGMLQQTKHITDDAMLKQLQKNGVNQNISIDLSRQSKMRKISLSKLEALIAKAHQEGKELPQEVKYLAGMIRVETIFFYPDQNDVVIAGPAEGWKQIATGEVVGRTSNRPVLHLDDLLVALRYVYDKQPDSSFMGVSIEPTVEGSNKYNAYTKSLGGRMNRRQMPQIFANMRQVMGPQDVKLFGVPKSSRFALILLVADYKMKRISLAHDRSPSRKVVSYLDLAFNRLKRGSRTPFQYRFWFMAKYDAIFHTKDRTAFRFSGHGVELLTARQEAQKPNQKPGSNKKLKIGKSAKQFTEAFTKNFPEMAVRVPVFAEMQNCIAFSVVAALIRQEANARKRWSPTVLLDNKKCPIEQYEVPLQVPTLLNYRIRNGQYLIGISGGVKINPNLLITQEQQQETADRTLLGSWSDSKRTVNKNQKRSNWWWD